MRISVVYSDANRPLGRIRERESTIPDYVRRIRFLTNRWAPRPLLRVVHTVRGTPYRPPVGRVHFGDLRRRTPISRKYGFDRGRPVDRYYIEGFLARHAADIRGRVLEINDSTYTTRFGGSRVVQRDVLDINAANPRATIVADLARADDVQPEQFDCIILTQVLQLIYDCRAAVQTVHRLLKAGGVLLATVPGITQIAHDIDNVRRGEWYWSFSQQSVQRLLHDAFPGAAVVVEAHGNVLAATAFLHGLVTEDLTRKDLEHQDLDYQVIVAARAVKHAPGGSGSTADIPSTPSPR